MKVNEAFRTLVLQQGKKQWRISRYIIDTNLKGSWVTSLLLSISKIKGISFPYFKPETAEKYFKGSR